MNRLLLHTRSVHAAYLAGYPEAPWVCHCAAATDHVTFEVMGMADDRVRVIVLGRIARLREQRAAAAEQLTPTAN